VINVQVVTQSGVIVTQTVTTTPSVPANSLSGAQRKSSGIAPGYMAAAVIAGLFGLAFICAGLFFCWRRKNRGEDSENKGAPSRDMQRNISVHSKAGLLDNRTYAPTINTRFSSHALDMGSSNGTTPVSPVSERRKSQPLMYDQRLNPNALMVNDNGSHTSLRTLDDHRDYGRMLKVRHSLSSHKISITNEEQVTNPDAVPERPSFS
jgi:cell wall integrity and stress response component